MVRAARASQTTRWETLMRDQRPTRAVEITAQQIPSRQRPNTNGFSLKVSLTNDSSQYHVVTTDPPRMDPPVIARQRIRSPSISCPSIRVRDSRLHHVRRLSRQVSTGAHSGEGRRYIIAHSSSCCHHIPLHNESVQSEISNFSQLRETNLTENLNPEIAKNE